MLDHVERIVYLCERFVTHQVFRIGWVCIVHNAILCVDVKFVTQWCPTRGHTH